MRRVKTMTEKEKLMQAIHNSLLNGQRKQMVQGIDAYLLYDFWADYLDYLMDKYANSGIALKYFADATISYFRISNR